MPVTFEAIERDVTGERLIDLGQLLGDTSEAQDDLSTVRDLATSAVFSRFDTRRNLAARALCGLLQSPVQIYRTAEQGEVLISITFNDIEEGFFIVGLYPVQGSHLEAVPTQREIDALINLAGHYADQE